MDVHKEWKNPFGKGPIFLAVIHVLDEEQAVRNAKIANESGCHGIWLICHKVMGISSNDLLIKAYKAVRDEFPLYWIGVNVLSFIHRPTEVFGWVEENCKGCNGIWLDNAFAFSVPVMERIKESRDESGWNGLYFGGVAFKYQDPVHPLQDADDIPPIAQQALKRICKQANEFIDVITTSGLKTGKLPSFSKISCMHSISCPLAISGCGLDVKLYKDIGDIFFCATDISKECTEHGYIDKCNSSFCELDPKKVEAWVNSCQ